jgi:hypothetical protein
MIKFLTFNFAVLLSFALYGCRSASESEPRGSTVPSNSAQTSKTPFGETNSPPTIPLDLARLADKSAAELGEAFGAPAESSALENGGDYRLYRIAGQTKGLAVRFYDNRAKNFNLILDEPVPTSKEALRRVFNIDVGASPPVRDAKEPLTESYRGTFGGVKFKKVSTKRQESGKGFIFVLAEVAE